MSRCLLGDRVRYDAEVNEYPLLTSFIQRHFDVVAVCPEVEIGLGVPRPPVQLTGSLDAIIIRGRDNPLIDITSDMHNYCQQRPAELNSIHGYIFKSKSPSCGVNTTPLFNQQGEITTLTSGVFVNAMLQLYPKLPITDEQGLVTSTQYNFFLNQVEQYQQKHTC